MKLRPVLMLAVFAVFITAGSMSASAQNWRDLGSKEVNDRVDNDTLIVTGWQGDVRRIKFGVEQAPVRFYKVRITYGNGRSYNIAIRNLIPKGGETRVIDLPGRERVINKVEFWYEAASMGPQRARVRLWGQD